MWVCFYNPPPEGGKEVRIYCLGHLTASWIPEFMSHFKTLNDPFPTSPLPRPPPQDGVQTLLQESVICLLLSSLTPSFYSLPFTPLTRFLFYELLIVALTHYASPHLHVALCASNPTASAAAVTLAPCTVALSHSVLIVCLHFCSSTGL